MKLLTLMRHAKSGWATDFHSDKSRTLSERGLQDAPMMSKRIQKAVGKPDFILCSSAHRTRETANFVLDTYKLSAQKICYSDRLYLASPGEMLKQIELVDNDVEHLMIVAHNPGTEMLGRMLHPSAPKTLPSSLLPQG